MAPGRQQVQMRCVAIDDIGHQCILISSSRKLEAAVSRAIEAGATIEGKIQTHNWGRIAHMADPFGHGICFIQFLGHGYDEISHE